MAISDFVKEVKSEKKLRPSKMAMDFLSSAAGLKLIKGVIKTKTQIDKRVKGARDFAGMPSGSDQEKVDRAIARIGLRLRDLEKQLDDLDRSLGDLEKSSEQNRKKKSERRKETIIKTKKVVKSPKTDSRSLTNVIELLKPVPKPAKPATRTKISAKPAAKKSAKPASRGTVKKAGSKKSPAKKQKKKVANPFTTQKSGLSGSGNLLDLKFKK